MSKAKAHTLRFEHLGIGYDNPVLNNLSAEFDSGITGIIGNNGRGKTTLLKTVSGLLAPLAGRLAFDDLDLAALSHQARARVASFNFSVNTVSFPMSVYELASMGRYPYTNQWALLAKNDDRIVMRALEVCGVAKFANKQVNALSDGERQKVFIAKSIAQETPLMMFDEPTAFLDYTSKREFFALLKELARSEKKVVLVSSHDIDFLAAYADHLLMIEDDGDTVVGETGKVVSTTYFKKHFSRV